MGPVILVIIVSLLIIMLALPALRGRSGSSRPREPGAGEEPHEVVVRRLDDHRPKKSPGDEPPQA